VRIRKTDSESGGGLAVADHPPAAAAQRHTLWWGAQGVPHKKPPSWGICFASSTCRALLSSEQETSKPPYGSHGALAAVAVLIARSLLVCSDVNICYFTS